MADRLSFDTTFLIDIQKERRSGQEGRAHRFLEQHTEAVMLLSAVALGEYAEGFSDPGDPSLQRLAAAVEILDVDRETSLRYGENARRLRSSGPLIGSNDLWIGCSAVRHGVALVTRNEDHFSRIAGLEVWKY